MHHYLALLSDYHDYARARLAEPNASRPEFDYESAYLGAVAKRSGAVAIVPIRGVIGPYSDWRSDTSAAALESTAKSLANDASVKAVLFDIDSPGGYVQGIPEAAAAISGLARAGKYTVAFGRGLVASAAYYLASQADQVIISPSGSVGSIGVVAMHVDFSGALGNAGIRVTFIHAGRHKVEGNPYESLGDEAKSSIQANVDEHYSEFVKAVSIGRKAGEADVRGERFGEGRMFRGKEAIKRGMADSVQSFDEVLAAMVGPTGTARLVHRAKFYEYEKR